MKYMIMFMLILSVTLVNAQLDYGINTPENPLVRMGNPIPCVCNINVSLNNQTYLESLFVKKTGDTMTGALFGTGFNATGVVEGDTGLFGSIEFFDSDDPANHKIYFDSTYDEFRFNKGIVLTTVNPVLTMVPSSGNSYTLGSINGLNNFFITDQTTDNVIFKSSASDDIMIGDENTLHILYAKSLNATVNVTAGTYYGDGSHLTNLPQYNNSYVDKSGDTMTGNLNVLSINVTTGNLIVDSGNVSIDQNLNITGKFLANAAVGKMMRVNSSLNVVSWQPTLFTLPESMSAGSVIAFNSANTGTALISAAGLKVLQNSAGTISWAATTGTGNAVYSTTPTITNPIISTWILFGSVSTAGALLVNGSASGDNITILPGTGNGKLGWFISPNGYIKNLTVSDKFLLLKNLNMSGLNITETNYVVSNAINTTNLYVSGNASIKRPYGSFSSTEIQTVGATATAIPMTFNWTESSYMVYKTSDNMNFSFGENGNYLVEISVIGQSSTPGDRLEIWIQKNGVNVPRSNTIYDFKGANANAVIAVPFMINVSTSDAFRVMYAGSSTNIKLQWFAGTAYSPETPSAIMTITKVSEATP